LQTTYGEISSNNLKGKVAGQDSNADAEWSTDFVGWSDDSIEVSGGDGTVDTPDGLIVTLIERLGAQAEADAAVLTARALPVYVMDEGFDLG
jgi:hypothetical protein